jgi:hypothetical protein
MHNSNCDSEGDYSRLHSSSTQNARNIMLSNVLPSRAFGLMPNKGRLTSLDLQMGQNGFPFYAATMHSDESHENEKNDFEGKCIKWICWKGFRNFQANVLAGIKLLSTTFDNILLAYAKMEALKQDMGVSPNIGVWIRQVNRWEKCLKEI